MTLITAKSKPLVEKAIQLPPLIELRHTTPKPFVHFSRSLAPAMTHQFGRPNIVVDTDPRVRFERNSRVIDEPIRQ